MVLGLLFFVVPLDGFFEVEDEEVEDDCLGLLLFRDDMIEEVFSSIPVEYPVK